MGMGWIHCMLGFSIVHSNRFSEELESKCTSMEDRYRGAFNKVMLATRALHDSIDAALAADGAASEIALTHGLGELRSANEQVSAFSTTLVEMRAELFERQAIDPDDPLLARERHFATLDYEAAYQRLLTAGAALPDRTYWDDLPPRLRKEGARGGLRLLDRHVRALQSSLWSLVGHVEAAGRLPLAARPHALHASTVEVAAVLVGFTRLLTTCTYFSMLCEETTRALESELTAQHVASAAAS
jgi:hypothetical protein